MPEYTEQSPKETYTVEQWVDQGDDDWRWQTWVRTKEGEVFQLPKADGIYGATIRFSPSERFLLLLQKTGSGENRALLYERQKNGRFRPLMQKASMQEDEGGFSNQAWDFFEKTVGFKASLYHQAVGSMPWEGETLAVVLSGQDLGNDYYVNDWRVHYDCTAKRWFLTDSDKAYNKTHGIISTQKESQ